MEITTPARGQEMGTRTGNFPVLPPLRACMRGQEIGILLKQPLTAAAAYWASAVLYSIYFKNHRSMKIKMRPYIWSRQRNSYR
eukprot:COSAG02_NODE_502_length_21039_cov_62.499045_6_plen_83_part_00